MERQHKEKYREKARTFQELKEFFCDKAVSLKEQNAFQKMNNLLSLILENNDLVSLNQDTFSSFTILSNINLKNNKFNDIDMRIFQNLTALEELDLSDNSISIIRKTDLKKLETLSKVDFSGNPIAKKNSISAQIKEMFKEDCRVILNKNLFN